MGLADTILRLRSPRSVYEQREPASSLRLEPLTGFGSNPGALAARYYVPKDLSAGAALVVVLHGCTQDAEGYDRGSGWSQLADEQGFALLFPQQVRANNANLCFNWFEPGDIRRGVGEVASIAQMVEAMIIAHEVDRDHVFVTGLSAGGAMTSALLAAYPDLFAGGAIIAGLPYAVAGSVPEALAQMRRASALPPSVREASGHNGPWPTISIWHGDADHVVHASNATAILDQWRAVHFVDEATARKEGGDRFTRSVWSDAAGRDVIEYFAISRMGHGTPLSTSGAEGYGTAGAHMLEVGVSSTWRIAQFWGLCRAPARARAAYTAPDDVGLARSRVALNAGKNLGPISGPDIASSGPGRLIEDALRAAALMR